MFDKPGSPGCSVGVIRDGEFVYKRSFGYASLELGVPLTSASVFYMASVSKQFTAASIVLAAEPGHLSLDDDVRKYLPALPDYGRRITLRQVLHQTSGFRDFLDLVVVAGRNAEDLASPAPTSWHGVRFCGASTPTGSTTSDLSDHPKPATGYHLKTGQRE